MFDIAVNKVTSHAKLKQNVAQQYLNYTSRRKLKARAHEMNVWKFMTLTRAEIKNTRGQNLSNCAA